MDRWPKKPCRYCGGMGHFPYQCFQKPVKIKGREVKVTSSGRLVKKIDPQWELTRKTWFRLNPPIDWPYPHYVCYICGKWVRPAGKARGLDNPLMDIVTLDHVLSRSHHPELVYVQSTLQPCCQPCNEEKGSKDGVLEVL